MANFTPKESLDWFKRKRLQPEFDYRDVWRHEHNTAFTVAKAMRMDILTDIKTALDDALARGETFASFKKKLRPLLEEKGWWGVQPMQDPKTGERKSVQLGSPRRLEIIYRTNMETARQAGQWERIQRSKATHPYLLYELGPSIEHRKEHEQWAGVLLPVDHPFWQTHRPKNGWGCKCRTRQVSKREYERMAASGKYQTTAPEISYRDWHNKRTGKTERVPEGIDPGFDYNPGAAEERTQRTQQFAEDRRQAAEAALNTPPPAEQKPLFIDPQQTFSSEASVRQADISATLNQLPEAQPQIDKLAAFLQATPIKTLFVKQQEMTIRNRSSQHLAEPIKTFLGDTRYPIQHAYAMTDPRGTNGFTSDAFKHVVIKIARGVDLSKTNINKLPTSVSNAIASYGQAVANQNQAQRLFSLRASFDAQLAEGETAGYLVTWLHEISHQIHFAAGAPAKPRGVKSLTRYSEKDLYEWHAEHITAWLLNRTALAQWDKNTVDYIDKLFEQVIYNR